MSSTKLWRSVDFGGTKKKQWNDHSKINKPFVWTVNVYQTNTESFEIIKSNENSSRCYFYSVIYSAILMHWNTLHSSTECHASRWCFQQDVKDYYWRYENGYENPNIMNWFWASEKDCEVNKSCTNTVLASSTMLRLLYFSWENNQLYHGASFRPAVNHCNNFHDFEWD